MTLPVFKTLVERVRAQGGGPVVLALDLGTRTGWAILHVDGRVAHGVVEFRAGEHPGHRFSALRLWLSGIHKKSGPIGLIVYELVQFSGAGAQTQHGAQLYGGWKATVDAWASLNVVPIEAVPVATLKKFITGSGNAPKDDAGRLRMDARRAAKGWAPYAGITVAEGIAQQGFTPRDNNDADALGLLMVGLERMVGRGAA